MFIAIMDEDGFVNLTAIGNVAHEARITIDEATEAIRILESPDENSADQEHDGRRIERVPGGWLMLNSSKYRDLVTRDIARQQVRERVAKHRAKKRKGNAPVTTCNGSVTQSEAYTEADKEPPSPLKGEVGLKFEEWKKFRKTLKRVKDWDSMFSAQIKFLLEFDERTQLEILNQSIRNGWQGLFEPKRNNGKAPPKPDWPAGWTEKKEREYREAYGR